MALPEFSLRQLLEAGVHFGHQTQRWNPRMQEFIYGERNGIHVIDLTQTVPMLDSALNAVRETVARGGRVLFVGTKRQAQRPVAEAAERCAQYYMNHRWLGGTLTNWKTVSQSIGRLKAIDEEMAEGSEGLTKRERLSMERDREKLQASLGGIRDMGGVPDMLFVIDVNKEALAVAEASKLGIPVAAVVDTNCSPDGIDHVIPGNDDASRAIALYCDLFARAVLDGMSAQMDAAGVDVGALEEGPPEEEALAEDSAVEEGSADEDPAMEKESADEASGDEGAVDRDGVAADGLADEGRAEQMGSADESPAEVESPGEKDSAGEETTDEGLAGGADSADEASADEGAVEKVGAAADGPADESLAEQTGSADESPADVDSTGEKDSAREDATDEGSAGGEDAAEGSSGDETAEETPSGA